MTMLSSRQSIQGGARHVNPIPVLSALAGAAWMAVLLRVYTRAHIVKRFLMEDWLLLVTIIIFSGYCGSIIAGVVLISRDEDAVLSLKPLYTTLELVMAGQSLYVATLMMLKLSISLMLLRFALFPCHRHVILATMVVSTVFSAAMILFILFQCGKFTGIADFVANRIDGKCVSRVVLLAMIYTHAGVTTFSDWTFIIIPILIVRGTKMTRREKIAAGTLLAFASAGAAGSIVRFFYIPLLAVPVTTYFSQSDLIAIWSGVEPGVGIIAASIVCLRPLLRHRFGLFRSANSARTTANSSAAPAERICDVSGARNLITRSITESKKELYDLDDQQLDWRSASASSYDIDQESTNWPLSVTPERGVRTEEAEVRESDPPPSAARVSLSQGLPLEIYSKRQSRYRDSWI